MLRHRADWRSAALMGVVSANLAVQWALPAPSAWLIALSVILALPLAAMAHNHNHSPLWRPAWMNALTSYWLSFFYGLPTMSWLVVHNWSHHADVNAVGRDITSTHNVGDRSDLWGVFTYGPASMGPFLRGHGVALARFWARSPARFAFYASHIVFLYGGLATLLILDPVKTLLFVVVPQQAGIFAITVFNYCQHVHTDERSRYNFARNFSSPLLNGYLFNAGYHTAHHLEPTRHWSELPELQARVAHEIDPRLGERSFWRYFARRIILPTFARRFRSDPLRAAAPTAPPGE